MKVIKEDSLSQGKKNNNKKIFDIYDSKTYCCCTLFPGTS